MEVNGYTRADLEKFEHPGRVKAQLEGLFSRYVNKFDKTDKFTFAGYNSPFDFRFMKEFWKKSGDKYWGSFFEYKQMDIYPLFQMYSIAAKLNLPNHKLVTAAAHFGLDFGDEGAHDAMADIRVTREVGIKVQEIFEVGIRVNQLSDDNRSALMDFLARAEAGTL
jgi:DNA polymerase-3 subunit epsilon